MDEDTVCPTCDRDNFKSQKGMQWHHAKQRGEPYRMVVKCSNCKKELKRSPYRVEQVENHFCNRECNNMFLRDRDVPEDHNFRRKGKFQYQCDNCDKTFERYPSRVVGEDTFCSYGCKNDAHRGTRHKGIHYGPNWKQQREKRLEKDGHVCVACKKTNDQEKAETGQSLQVHHVRKARRFRTEGKQIDYERANRVDNLLTLCAECHHRWEGIPLKPQID